MASELSKADVSVAGSSVIKFYSPVDRCYILENDTVQCDTDLYKSLQAWKDHKLHIDHEVSDLNSCMYVICCFILLFLTFAFGNWISFSLVCGDEGFGREVVI